MPVTSTRLIAGSSFSEKLLQVAYTQAVPAPSPRSGGHRSRCRWVAAARYPRQVKGRRAGAPADDRTLRRLAGHAFHREQCMAVWEIRLAPAPRPSPEDCRHLPATAFWGLPLPTTSHPAPTKITIYGWSIRPSDLRFLRTYGDRWCPL